MKSGGALSFQMGFDNWVRKGFSEYYANTFDATGTNCIHDDCITDIAQIREHLEEIGFDAIVADLRPVGPGDVHHNWLFVRAFK